MSHTAFLKKYRYLLFLAILIIGVAVLRPAVPMFADILAITENPAPVFPTLIPDQAYVLKDNTGYKLYYAGNDFASINLAESSDGVNWTPYAGNPVLAEAPGVQGEHADVQFYAAGFTGANTGTNPGAVTMYYRMWYQGTVFGIAGWRYAESPDGITWYNRMAVTQTGTPVFSAATGANYGIASVVYTPGGEGGDVNKTFRIYANVQWEIAPYGGNEPVVMAYSPNGYDWTGYDPTAAGYATPVFAGTHTPGDFDSDHIGWFKVIKNSNTDWEAFYSGGTTTTYQDLNGIGYATSTDGINWTRRETLFTTNDGVAWRAKSVWMPSVVKTGNTYEIWFLGSDNPNIGASDWIQWELGEADLVKTPTTWNVPGDNSGTCTTSNPSCATIQAAIDAASSGDTIDVSAGTYGGNMETTKGLIINGPNANINPNTGVRVAEAIINNGTTGIRISTTETVTINGFTINGTGAPIDSYTTGNAPIIKDNIIKNTTGDIFLNNTNTLIFQDNLLSNLDPNSEGMQLTGNWDGTTGTTATITGNVWTNYASTGINLSNVSGSIKGNTFNNISIYGILLANNSSNMTVSGNIFENITNPDPTVSTWGAGIRFFNPTLSGPVTITDNLFKNDAIGIAIRPDGAAHDLSTIVVNHNSFTGDTIGVFNAAPLDTILNATGNWWGDASGPSDPTPGDASIPITNAGTGSPVNGAVDYSNWCTAICAVPIVTAVDPVSAAANTSPGRAIIVTFSEAMDPATITTSTFTLKKGLVPIAGSVSYSGLKARFIPNVTLDSNSIYKATITTGVKDTSGTSIMADYTWNFTTGWNYHDWTDQGVNYTVAPADAYYPSVIYDANGFGAGAEKYSMWYSDGAGSVYLVKSTDGVTWGTPVTMTGMPNAHHDQVLYDANCFGVLPCSATTTKYRIWFWDMGAPTIYSISSMATAESADGINWINKTAVTQNPAAKLIQDPDLGVGWNRGTYGPISMFYQPGASNSGTEPWDYRYVMYYNGTDGSHEDTGLAYSTDGLYWNAYTTNPVLSGSGTGGSEAWDCASASYGTVFKDSLGYHYFYSGRGQDDGLGGCAFPASFNGIGYASSIDGKTWVKDAKPIFEISDGVLYRSGRIYTPSIINDGSGLLKMYFTAKDSLGGPKTIGYATLTEPAMLHIIKKVVNDNGGTATASLFILHVKLAGTDVTGSPAAGTAVPGTLYSLATGTYTVSEDANAAYTRAFSGDCDATGNITLAPGDNKTCTITNSEIASVGGGGGGSNTGTTGGYSPPATTGLHPSAGTPAPVLPVCLRTADTIVPFTDDINQWSIPYIETLYRKCIIDGRTATLFEPEDTISRAELVKIAVNAFKLKAAAFENLFQDVKKEDWFMPYVISASKLKIVEGYVLAADIIPFFMPNQDVTRAEAIKILLKAKGITDFGSHTSRFPDVTPDDWFYPFITYIEDKGIIEGYTETYGKSGPVRNYYSLPYLLGPGNSSKTVKTLKEILTQLGYYHGAIDQNYDQQLADAVTAYQVAKGITPTGYMGQYTRTAILNEILVPTQITVFSPNKPITREEVCKITVLIMAL